MNAKVLRNELRVMRGTMGEMCTMISDIKVELQRSRERITELETNYGSHDKRFDEEDGRITLLEHKSNKMRQDLNETAQDLYCNDVEIDGIPENATVPVMDIVLLVAEKLGVSLRENDIVHAMRLGSPRVVMDDDDEPRPRRIAVRFVRRKHCYEMLQAARSSGGITTAELWEDAPEREFYVSERLTRYNRQVYIRARQLSKRANWRYVWVRNGRIYVRKGKSDPRYRIRGDRDTDLHFFADEN